jgi:VWFA-related protein
MALWFCVAFALSISLVQAQSGRVKTPPTGKTKTTTASGDKKTITPSKDLPPGPPAKPETGAESPTPSPTPERRPRTAPDQKDVANDDDVVRVESNLVAIPASIVDRQGRAVVDLKLEDFELLIDSEKKTLNALSRSETPVKLALLFDNSSSIDKAREFEKQAAIKFFKKVLRPIDQAALYSVTDEIILVQKLTNDVRRLTQAIESFGKPEGATSLHDAIVQAAFYLKPFQDRKVIVIVSDGEDTTSRIENFDEALRMVQEAGCQVYAINTKQFEYLAQTGKPTGNANIRALIAERRLQEMTSQTGGAVYAPLSNRDVDEAFAQIAAELSQQYVLTYYADEDTRDGKFRAITLRVPARKDLNIRARKGYYSRRK